MSTVAIDKDKLMKIIKNSYKEIKKYNQKTTSTKQAAINNIVSMIEKEFKNENKQD